MIIIPSRQDKWAKKHERKLLKVWEKIDEQTLQQKQLKQENMYVGEVYSDLKAMERERVMDAISKISSVDCRK